MAKKKFQGGELLQRTITREGTRYNCGIGKDKGGYFACTHRARSDSYPSKKAIPKKALKWIEGTG